MSTTQTQQTQEELSDILVKFEAEARRTGLAETDHNQRLLSDFLKTKYGGYVNGATLADAVASLKPQLQWLAKPEPVKPTVKLTGNRLWNKLADCGVLQTRHSSVSDIQEQRNKADAKKQAHIDLATTFVERSRLLVARQEAATITITDDRGRIRWSKTMPAREEAKRRAEAAIQAFNSKVSDDLKISI